MQIRQAILNMDINDSLPVHFGHYLRGYFANRFSEVLFHNHLEDGRYRYGYPLVQYKIVGGKPVVVGINEGADLISKHFMDVEELVLGDQVYAGFEKTLKVEEVDLIFNPTLRYRYEWLTPWMGLNQRNFQAYQQVLNGSVEDRQEFFQRILVGNILSFAKAAGCWVESQIFVAPECDPRPVQFKGQSMVGFVGYFYANLTLPNLIGLGNSSARGFGTIQRK